LFKFLYSMSDTRALVSIEWLYSIEIGEVGAYFHCFLLICDDVLYIFGSVLYFYILVL